MKTYEEVAKSVFEKSEKYFEEKAIRAKRIKTAATAMSCFCLAAVLTVGAIAALNSNLTERPLSGGADNNAGIPAVDETTTTETDPLTTQPIMMTDENGDPIYPEIDIPDERWESQGGCSYGSGIPSVNSDYIWQTAKAILGADYGIEHHGVIEKFFLVYDGALYVSYTPPEDKKADRRYASTGTYAYFGEGFPCEVYAVKDEPNLEPKLIAIKLNFAIHEYRRLFYFNYSFNDEQYRIAYSALKDIDHACGDIVLEGESFTVYEAVRLQGEPSGTKEYIVDLLPVLESEFPDLFSDADDADYADRWWIALPVETAELLSHADVPLPLEDHDLPINTNILTEVTPKDTDRILAAAQKASSNTGDRTVFVRAENGSEIYSLTYGTVVMEGWCTGDGKTIIVQTTDGDYIMYSHLSEIYAKKGDPVAPAKIIGLAGNTGATAYSGVAYAVRTSLPAPEKCAVILPEIPKERTEAELIEEIVKLDISAIFVWSDDIEERIIPMEENSEILSLTDGEVIWIKKYGDTYNSVCVQYSEDTFVYYDHLSRPSVKIGDTVSEGQRIGYAGDIEFVDSIFDFGVGYRLSHTPPVLSLNTDETHHDDETHHSNNETHHGLIS